MHTSKTKNLKVRFPTYLLIPSARDFGHGAWMDHLDDEENYSTKVPADPYTCDVRCCYVGWVGVAMGEPAANPTSFGKASTREFLILSLAEVSGRPREVFTRLDVADLGLVMSDLFEHGVVGDRSDTRFGEGPPGTPSLDSTTLLPKYRTGDRGQMMPGKACKLFKAVGRQLGYDVENAS